MIFTLLGRTLRPQKIRAKEQIVDNRTRKNQLKIYLTDEEKENFKIKNLIFYHGWSSSAENQLFRANIFASFGYRVFLPDAIFHG